VPKGMSRMQKFSENRKHYFICVFKIIIQNILARQWSTESGLGASQSSYVDLLEIRLVSPSGSPLQGVLTRPMYNSRLLVHSRLLSTTPELIIIYYKLPFLINSSVWTIRSSVHNLIFDCSLLSSKTVFQPYKY
jgi:hypothetical protein